MTNPPIDPLREAHVMSLATCIGREMNVFLVKRKDKPIASVLNHPFLLYSDFQQLLNQESPYYSSITLDITYQPTENNLETALHILCETAQQAVNQWCSITGFIRQKYHSSAITYSCAYGSRARYKKPW